MQKQILLKNLWIGTCVKGLAACIYAGLSRSKKLYRRRVTNTMSSEDQLIISAKMLLLKTFLNGVFVGVRSRDRVEGQGMD